MDERRQLDQDLERAWEELQDLHLAMHRLTHSGPDAEFRVIETLEAAERYVLPGIEPWRYSSASEPVPRGHWQGVEGVERAQAATRQLLGELGWGGLSAEEIALQVTGSTFLRHGLSGMLSAVYDNSPYAALADLFPELRPWQMSKAPLSYWKGEAEERRERGRQATRWLLRRMGLSGASPGEVASQVDQRAFNTHGLRGMLKHVYNSSPYEALADVMPDLQPCARRVTFDDFRSHGLMGMLANVYGNNPTAALADIFPELQPWQRGVKVPKGYWRGEQGREHARAATRWLLDQLRLGLGLQGADPATIAERVHVADFKRARLGGMLVHVYNSRVRAALTDALADVLPVLPDPERSEPQG